jgi:predicted metal-dependent hydrolase
MEVNVNAAVDAEFIGQVIGEALAHALLCSRCTALLEERSAAKQSTEQKQICPDCQSVINQLIARELERRVRELLQARGLPPNAIQVGHTH